MSTNSKSTKVDAPVARKVNRKPKKESATVDTMAAVKEKTKKRSSKKSAEVALNAVKKELLDEYGDVPDLKQKILTDILPQKKKRDRFHGMSEDEVMCRTLPDHLVPDLDIVIIGINPGLTAAYVGHHYAGPGNHFWKCLLLSGLISEPMNAYDDFKLKEVGIGFTNIVERTSRGSADLTRKEIKEGAELLTEKIQKYKPKIAAFNGKGIYEVFLGHKNFFIGKQPEPFPGTDTVIFVMPSSSARCSQLPRAVDKVPFYLALKKLRDHARGTLPDLDESEVIFADLELKVEPKKERLEKAQIKAEPDLVVKSESGTKAAPKRRKRKTQDAVVNAPQGHEGSSPSATGATQSPSSDPFLFGPPIAANTMNPFHLAMIDPYLSPFMVKEELPQDLSQYGRMPCTSDLPSWFGRNGHHFNNANFDPAASYGRHDPSLSTGVYASAAVGGVPLSSGLAASFAYAPPSTSSMPRLQPSATTSCDDSGALNLASHKKPFRK